MPKYNIEEVLRNLRNRIIYYYRELSITSNASQKFEIEKRIEEDEERIKEIRDKKHSLINYKSKKILLLSSLLVIFLPVISLSLIMRDTIAIPSDDNNMESDMKEVQDTPVEKPPNNERNIKVKDSENTIICNPNNSENVICNIGDLNQTKPEVKTGNFEIDISLGEYKSPKSGRCLGKSISWGGVNPRGTCNWDFNPDEYQPDIFLQIEELHGGDNQISKTCDNQYNCSFPVSLKFDKTYKIRIFDQDQSRFDGGINIDGGNDDLAGQFSFEVKEGLEKEFPLQYSDTGLATVKFISKN